MYSIGLNFILEKKNNNTATEDKQIHSAVSYRANVMLARFKVGNTARGGQTVNVTGQYV